MAPGAINIVALRSTEEVAMKSDAELRRDVMEELAWEPALDAEHLGVICRDGVVTLSGHVDSYAAKTAAERAARRVKGVRAIAMEIDVHLPSDKKTADDEIAGRAVKILQWDTMLPADRIQVEVEDGVVTLTGTVGWGYQREEAERDIRKLTGVRGVVNGLRVEPPVRAGEVHQRILNAMRRSAEVNADHIRVTASDGRVILSGKVNSWVEREAAERTAWSAPGVISVQDDITIGRP
jgi:osmotically-inducible protein OsmY